MYNKMPEKRPEGYRYYGIDHLHFYVGNAKQAASFYTSRFGFVYCAYRGLETGTRDISTHVVKSPDQKFYMAFSSPYSGLDSKEMSEHFVKHGDGVKDICYSVENCKKTYENAISNGADAVYSPKEFSDENGTVVMSAIKTFNDTIHTFLERRDYRGPFLPGYEIHPKKDPFNKIFKPNPFLNIDHVVANLPDKCMNDCVKFYEKVLGFNRYWTADDGIIHTEFSALNSITMSDFDETIKMPINEPVKGKKRSQTQEFCDFYEGGGVQHIALGVKSIIPIVENMTERGTDFLPLNENYYDILKKRIEKTTIDVNIKEDFELLQKNKILVDYDEDGYLLQIFTKTVEDRATVFYELIQRENCRGFGVGNFKALFQCLEKEQRLRKTLSNIIKDNA